MSTWQRYDHPSIALRFKFPRRGTDGEPVVRLETEKPGLFRVHILASKSREVYFEVSKFSSLDAESEYRQHIRSLSEQFHTIAVTELIERVFTSLPAHEYSFEWESGIRTVILVEASNATYRILYDPRYPLNREILSTVEWLNLP
jgi:hypothetical protein